MQRQLSRVSKLTINYFLLKAKYIVFHPIKTMFFIIKLYFTLLLLAFFLTASFSTFAQTIYDGLTTIPKEEGTQHRYVSSLTGGRQFFALFITGDRILLNIPSANDVCQASLPSLGNPNLDNATVEISEPQTFGDFVRTTYNFRCEGHIFGTTINACGSNPIPCRRESEWNYNTIIDTVSTQVCPENTVLNDDLCYSLLDVREADDCPDSITSPDFILPSDSSGNSSVCLGSDNGSMCAYSLSGDGEYYTYDFESNCYAGDIPPFQEEGFNESSDNTEATCEDIGGGVSACVEDPENVCSDGQCQEGCGFFGLGDQTEFICLAGDLDNDGIPDYADPDIDGDGIPNRDDLDSDGDGRDDLDFSQNDDSNVNVDVNVDVDLDTSGIESAITSQTTDIVSAISSLEDNLTPSADVDFTIPQELVDAGTLNDDSVRNYGTVLQAAVSDMQTAPIFQAVDGFFEVSFSGTCPVYSTFIDYIQFNLVIDHFCSPVMNSVWPIISTIIILIFSYLAFRVAVL